MRAAAARAEDAGYASESGGGPRQYDRRAQRLAYEQQRARAEAEHRKYLELSGKAGGQPARQQTYKLQPGKKNVKKSDSGRRSRTTVSEERLLMWALQVSRLRARAGRRGGRTGGPPWSTARRC